VSDAPARTLPTGVIPQIYRGAIRGATRHDRLDAIARALDALAPLGVTAVAWHGFVDDLDESRFDELATLAAQRGMASLAAFGLGPSRPEYKGAWMGRVAALPHCAGLVEDAEGAFDHGQQAATRAMCQATRAAAPDAVIAHQPWPVPTLHWDFPYEEFAAIVDIDAPQFYYNDFKGRYGGARYAKCLQWFEGSWARLEQRLAARPAPRRPRTRIQTVQAYGWTDILPDLVHCLTHNTTLLAWSDPFPADDFVLGLRVVQALRARGFAGPDAVRAFQTSAGLAADDRCGPLTLAALGLSAAV
jgi:hypothetical protein